MQMPLPRWFSYELIDRTMQEIKAFEHEVAITLPRRRYRPDVYPKVLSDSPSVVTLGFEERYGTELAVRRISYDAQPDRDMAAEMVGELAEVWVFMTCTPARPSG